uniref:Uncharacterized protein n=1 Tax=uncultured bacterium contig00029 TaxID=1181518 RepID=A0A806KC00_9BACT|nr:hypothetical protein [uncultured bacterium contig00029]
MFQFSIPIANPQESFEKAKKAIKDAGATLNGDSNAGSFSGSGVEGSYAFSGGNLNIKITKKPFIAPESMIKSKVSEFFS